MSTTRTYQIQNIIEVQQIKIVEPKELLVAEKQITELLQAKLEKMLASFPQLETKEVNGVLQLFDDLGIATDLKEIAQAFGFVITEIPVDKGKLYSVAEGAYELLRMLKKDKRLAEMHTAAVKGESISITETERVQVTTNVTTYDGSELSRQEAGKQLLGATNLSGAYQDALARYNAAVQGYVSQHNAHMVNGTTASVTCRAKKMGYAVQKKQVGQQIELVLVRVQ